VLHQTKVLVSHPHHPQQHHKDYTVKENQLNPKKVNQTNQTNQNTVSA
jgi:hypothetical protein